MIIKVKGHPRRWLGPGNRTFLEVDSLVVTWCIVGFFAKCQLLDNMFYSHDAQEAHSMYPVILTRNRSVAGFHEYECVMNENDLSLSLTY